MIVRHTNILLLANVFENFCLTYMDLYVLDLAHDYSRPILLWDVLLKYASVELELLTDVDVSVH